MVTTSSQSRSEQVARGGALLLLGGVGGRTLLYGGHILLARAMSVVEVGFFFLALTLVQGLGLLATLGLDVGLLRFAPLYQLEDGRARLDALLQGCLLWCGAACLVLSASLVAFAPEIAGWLRQPGLEPILPIFALVLPALCFQRVLTNLFQALSQVRSTILLRNLLYPVLFLCGLIPVYFFHPAAGAAALVLAVSAGAPALLGAVWLRTRYGFLRRGAVGRLDASLEVLRFSAPVLLAGVIGYAALWMDSFLAGYFMPPEEVGRYSIALRLSMVGAILLEAFNGALGPAASSLFARDRAALEPVYRDVTRLALSLYLPVLGVMWIAPGALLGLFGPAYTDAETEMALRILALGQLVNVGVGGAGMLLVMAGRPWLNLLNGVGMVAINAALCALFIPRYGVVGAAMASATGVAVINLTRVLELRAIVRLHPFHRSYLKSLVAFGIAMAAGLGVRRLAPHLAGGWTGVGALCLVYAAVMLMLGLEAAERDLLRRVASRLGGGNRRPEKG